jgi:cysteine desulfurase
MSPRHLPYRCNPSYWKILVDLRNEWEEVDLLSFSGHKFHGPKGVGGLYLRPGTELPPLLLGGGQEDGYRSGTTNTPGLAGLAVAAAECEPSSNKLVAELRDKFEIGLRTSFPDVQIHSADTSRLPNTSYFSLPGVVAEDLAARLAAQGIIVGTGSACTSGAVRPSKTLLAMKVDYEVARAALRVSLDASTSMEQLSTLLNSLATILAPAPM